MVPRAAMTLSCLSLLLFAGCVTDDEARHQNQNRDTVDFSPMIDGSTAPLDCSGGGRASSTGDTSLETLRVWLESDGPWSVGIPFPVSDDGTAFDDWLQDIRLQGTVHDAKPENTTRGPVLRIDGTGNILLCGSVHTTADRGGYAESFLDAGFSTPQNGGAYFVQHHAGAFTFWVMYHATSNYCTASYAERGTGYEGAEWIYMSGGIGAMCE